MFIGATRENQMNHSELIKHNHPTHGIQLLLNIIDHLRDPENGCPWDLKQTHQSLLKYLLEESYEYIDAVERQSINEMEEELGDVLLQIVLHAKLASEKSHFNFDSVAEKLALKMIYRHPHVFKNHSDFALENENELPKTADDVLKNWEQIKKSEQSKKNQSATNHHSPQKIRRLKKSLLFMPALTSALNIGKKTAEIKFDWDDPWQVAYKVEEEWQELKEEMTPQNATTHNQERIKEEFGDLLFSMAQLGRHLGIDPEEALKSANQKFLRRFYQMEDLMFDRGIELEKLNQTEMDVFWNEAKKTEKKIST